MARMQTELENFLREHGPFTEREVIAANLKVALEVCQGNKTHAARMLGLTRFTIIRRIGWLLQDRRRVTSTGGQK